MFIVSIEFYLFIYLFLNLQHTISNTVFTQSAGIVYVANLSLLLLFKCEWIFGKE